jgi:hypothetical protein
MRVHVLTYAAAVAEWIAAGRPIRSDAETQSIFRVFCSHCLLYEKTRRRCRECGCRVTPNGPAIINKIRMATQHCPIRRW